MSANEDLTAAQLELLAVARRAVLATTAADGHARLVPMAFISITGDSKFPVLYSALDDKPKSVADPRDLARVRDIAERPRVTVLVDRWSEEWSQLAWLRLEGDARLIEPTAENQAEHAAAVHGLLEKYPQYATHRLETAPLIRVDVDRMSGWVSRP
jgi:PPOX class probable F420-dependent enzyme